MPFNSSGLRALTNVFGPSGAEARVADFITRQIRPFSDAITRDGLGNLIAHKRGAGPKLMIAAHMDTIGFMVKRIDKNGYGRVSKIGGILPKFNIYQRLVLADGRQAILTKKETIKLTEALTLNDFYLDLATGDPSALTVGDRLVYQPNYYETDDAITSPYLDDRIGCFIMIETLKQLTQLGNDCYFVFTIQEEVGCHGAQTAAHQVAPDFGLAIDVSPVGDTGDINYVDYCNLKLGNGVAIKARDAHVLPPQAYNDWLMARATEQQIPYQIEVLDAGGTDAGKISMAHDGVPSSCLSIPCRHVHSSSETVAKSDVLGAIKLLTQICQQPIDYNR